MISDGLWMAYANYLQQLAKNIGIVQGVTYHIQIKGHWQADAAFVVEGANQQRLREAFDAFDVNYFETRDGNGIIIPRSMQG